MNPAVSLPFAREFSDPARRATALRFILLLGAILALACFVYAPGLDGTFEFDDFVNLNALGMTGPVKDWPSFWRYITSGVADPTGRPLTLLSFLIDAQDWPADPYGFKRTNLLLHLLNGALLCWSMLLLGARAGIEPARNRAAALLGSALWLLHPLFVSTTLYIVQREAMLPATFTFCALVAWCKGRSAWAQRRTLAAVLLFATGAWLCTLLATLCKANGALLPLLLACAEFLLPLAPTDEPRPQRLPKAIVGVFLLLPIAALVALSISEIPWAIQAAAINRPWTIGQRLLSEPRIVLDYLRLLWIPRSTSFGLFNDQIAASTDWLHPWTTLPSLVLIGALFAGAWFGRRRWPLAAFAVLFYFAGQSMESTFLPLELAFEHRNYLPAAFMFWPLAHWLVSRERLGLVLSGVFVALLALLTWNSAVIWSDIRLQALIWAKVNADSPRAQAMAANIETRAGHVDEARRRLQLALEKRPDEVQLTLNLLGAECAAGAVSNETLKAVDYSFGHTSNGSRLVYDWFENAIGIAQSGACANLTLDAIRHALDALENNPTLSKNPGRRADAEHVAGRLALAENKPDEARVHFDRALVGSPDAGRPLAQAALLGSAGYPALGLRHLDDSARIDTIAAAPLGMSRVHQWLLREQHYWEHERAALRAALKTDAERQGTPAS